MAIIVKASKPSVDMASLQHAPFVSALVAGENIASASPCRIGSDGKAYMAVTTSATIANVTDYVGFAPEAVASGMPVTLFKTGARFYYGENLTPNTWLYPANVAGALSDTRINTADNPIALVINSTDILVLR